MQYFGIYRGTCINNLDPMALGRLQVVVPAISASGEPAWAQPCRALGMPGAAPPSVGESVWVMFEGGDASRPVVIGTRPE